MQERRNSSVLAMELRLSCIDPSIYVHFKLPEFWPEIEDLDKNTGGMEMKFNLDTVQSAR